MRQLLAELYDCQLKYPDGIFSGKLKKADKTSTAWLNQRDLETVSFASTALDEARSIQYPDVSGY